MDPALLDDHQCAYRTRLSQLEAELAERKREDKLLRERVKQLEDALARINSEFSILKRNSYGQRRERHEPVEPVKRELNKGKPADPKETQRKRAARRELKKSLPERVIVHKVPPEQRRCEGCGKEKQPVGEGKESFLYEAIAVRIERQRHVRETLECPCCKDSLVTAPAPPRVLDNVQYGPGLIAQIIVDKCADALPLHRQAERFERMGVPMSRSTLGDLYHNAAQLLEVLALRIQGLVAMAEIVQADETPQPVLEKGRKKTRRAYMWVFVAQELGLLCYVYSATRSGQTPKEVLGASEGTLVVDAYTGYNPVCTPEGRGRAGCLGHGRRKFFDALGPTPQEARSALAQILELYRVEAEALERGIVGTSEHLALRQSRSKPLTEKFKAWLDEEQPKHAPKSPLGKAISYAQNQWETLVKFLEDSRIPLDNNLSERLLRIIALQRKNSLFVGNDRAGKDHAVLQTLVGCCELNDINPQEYLADVLVRISTTPQSQIDELLPPNWKAAREEKQRQEEASLAMATGVG